MSDYTLCVALTWQIAAEEAAGARQEFIEPEHLFIGLCKLVSFTQPEELRRLGLPDTEAAPVKAEIDTLQGLFARFNVDPVNLRRELRQRKATGLLGLKIFDRPREGRIIHRSPQTRQVFTRATELARDANAFMTTVTHLLGALLDHPNLAVPAWLRKKNVDVVGLKQAALAAPLPRLPETPAPPASAVARSTANLPPSTLTGIKPMTTVESPASASRVYTTHSIMLAQSSPDEALALAQRRLKIFYSLGQQFSSATTVDRVLRVMTDELARAMPQAQAGVVLIPDARGELMLSAHWPAGAPLFSSDFAKRAVDERHSLMWVASPEGTEAPTPPPPASGALAALYVPLLWGDAVLGVVGLENRLARDAFTPDDLEFLSAVASQATLFIQQHHTQQALKRQEAMRQSLLNRFSPKVAELLVQRGHLRLGHEPAVQSVVVLLATLRGFSSLSANMGPDGVVQALDEIFSVFVPILSAHNGTLEKNSGESFLAVFEPHTAEATGPWERAVRSAHEMQRTVQRLEDQWQRRGWLACDLGIGIHTGEILAGVDAVENNLYPTLDELVVRAARYSEGAGRGEVILSQAVFARVYHWVDVTARTLRSASLDPQPDVEGYVVRRLRETEPALGV